MKFYGDLYSNDPQLRDGLKRRVEDLEVTMAGSTHLAGQGAGGPRGNNFSSIPAAVRQAGQTECRIVGRGGDGIADPRMTFVGVMAK